MSNHVHLVMVPHQAKQLPQIRRYAIPSSVLPRLRHGIMIGVVDKDAFEEAHGQKAIEFETAPRERREYEKRVAVALAKRLSIPSPAQCRRYDRFDMPRLLPHCCVVSGRKRLEKAGRGSRLLGVRPRAPSHPVVDKSNSERKRGRRERRLRGQP